MPSQEELKSPVLPVGFTFEVKFPIEGFEPLRITTNEEGHNLQNTIYAFIRRAVELRQGVFANKTIAEVSHDIAETLHGELTPDELKQYNYAPISMLASNAYNRFLAMVLTRLNGEDIISKL